MPHLLETGLEFLDANNPNGLPKVKGYNIINGELTSSSDGETFVSRNPAILDDELGVFLCPQKTMFMLRYLLQGMHSLLGQPLLRLREARLSGTWEDC